VNRLFIIFIVGFLIFNSLSKAAQDTTVVVDNATVHVEPNINSKVIEYLAEGAEVRVSSFPLQNEWYKIRSKNGIYGWVHLKNLSLAKKPKLSDEEDPETTTDPSIVAPAKPARDRKFYLHAVGGVAFFSPKDLNTLFLFDGLNNGYYGGAELGYSIYSELTIFVRFMSVFKNTITKENVSSQTYNLALRSYPFGLGVDYYIFKLPAARLAIGGSAGIALATSFSSEAYTLSAPNTVVLQSNPWFVEARLKFVRPLGRIFSVGLEAGYRYLRTAELETTGALDVNGADLIFRTGNIYPRRVIDLSGPFAGVTFGVHF
jgi:uncharacterized protein YgiM (DUF1202 family)